MSFGALRKELYETVLSLAPAILMIVIFQLAFIRLPALEFLSILLGLVFTVFGFVFFIQGAKLGLLPLGQGVGTAFIERRAVRMILVFGFMLGVVLTVAEPDVRLLAFQMEAAEVLSFSRNELIAVAAVGLGVFSVLALIRIMFDSRIQVILLLGYALVLLIALFSAEDTIAQAFDMGAVTTGPMTVPFLMALGVGMASVLGGRDRLKTGFGLMAVASIGPVLAILVWAWLKGLN